jgi:hypothetical protein
VHLVGEREELGEKVVHRELVVVGRALLGKRLAGIVKRVAQRAAHREAPRDSDGPERVEAVGILHDPRFERARGHAGRKAVCLDCVADGCQVLRGVAGAFEEVFRAPGRFGGGGVPLGGVLRGVRAVVQPRGGHDHGRFGAFHAGQAAGHAHHALGVRPVVRRVGGRVGLLVEETPEAGFPRRPVHPLKNFEGGKRRRRPHGKPAVPSSPPSHQSTPLR